MTLGPAFVARRDAALALLDAAGIARGTSEPPLMRLLWRLGLEVPPPHFLRFAVLAVGAGAYFCLFWGLAMAWFWYRHDMPARGIVESSVLAGSLFGVFMAAWFARSRRTHRLPSWEDVPVPGAPAATPSDVG